MMNDSQIGLLILGFAILVFILSRLIARQSGLPDGKLMYSDDVVLQPLPKPIYDRTLNLVGKPDYVVALKDGTIVPVEFKSQSAPTTPFYSHVMQLVAYCYLCEINFKQRPTYGLIKYADKTFKVDYDQSREQELLNLVAEIRHHEAALAAPELSHMQPARCRGCGFNSICDQKM